MGQRYIEMVFEGVVAAQYLTDLDVGMAPESIALVAPIYTYLLSGHVARFQFWLDIGSISWWEPPHQPLTNPQFAGAGTYIEALHLAKTATIRNT